MCLVPNVVNFAKERDGDSYYSEEFWPGDPSGSPFVVRVSNEHWIPVSIVIYAKDETDAQQRLVLALEFIAERCRKLVAEIEDCNVGFYEVELEKTNRIMELIKAGHVKMAPFDKRLITWAPWASNDHLV
jgi:hypothetical protein